MTTPKAKKSIVSLSKAIIENDHGGISNLAKAYSLNPKSIRATMVGYQGLRNSDGYDPTPLLISMFLGEIEICKCLIQEGADPNAGHLQGFAPLTFALELQLFPIASLLIKSGADVNLANKTGKLPMCWAIRATSPVNIVKDILAAGMCKDAIINIPQGTTSLLKAVIDDNVPVVKYLLDQCVNINVQDTRGFTPLGSAVFCNRVKIVDLLVKKGSNVDGLGKGDVPPLYLALCNDAGRCTKAFRILVNAGADVNQIMEPSKYIMSVNKQNKSFHLLHFVVSQFNTEVLKILLKSGGETAVNFVGGESQLEPLQVILKMSESEIKSGGTSRYRQIIQLLLEHGADLNVKLSGMTIPHFLVDQKKWVALEELIKFGIDVNTTVNENLSVLHYVVMNNKFELTEMCLEHGGDLHTPVSTKQGTVLPIHFAKSFGSDNLIKLVARHTFSGIDRPIEIDTLPLLLEKNILKHDSALSGAIKSNKTKLAEEAFAKGAQVCKGTVLGLKYALLFPITNRNPELLELLLQHGVHLSRTTNVYKFTYLNLAMVFCDINVIRLLLTYGASYNHRDAHGITPDQIGLEIVRHDGREKSCSEFETFIQEFMDHVGKRPSEEDLSEVEVLSADTFLGGGETMASWEEQNKEKNTGSSSQVQETSGEEPTKVGFESTTKVIDHGKKAKRLLRDISRMFSMVRRGDAKVLKILEAKKKKSKEFLCYINCINRRGNTFMSEALRMGFSDIAEGIMKLRLEED